MVNSLSAYTVQKLTGSLVLFPFTLNFIFVSLEVIKEYFKWALCVAEFHRHACTITIIPLRSIDKTVNGSKVNSMSVSSHET